MMTFEKFMRSSKACQEEFFHRVTEDICQQHDEDEALQLASIAAYVFFGAMNYADERIKAYHLG
jgi:hypothetical protein